MNSDIKKLSVNNGLYLGGALALLTVLAYAFNLDLFTKWWFGIITIALIISVATLSLINAKHMFNGYITFKNAFTSYFITTGIGLIVNGIVSVFLFNIIDQEAAIMIKTKIIETQIERMKQWGTSLDTIEEFISALEKQGNMYSIGNVLQSIVFQIVGYSIVGLILSAILKKNPEN